jgi:anti-anti-sigma regulatory factor
MSNRLISLLPALPPKDDPVEREQAPALQVFLLTMTAAALLWTLLPLLTAGNGLGLAFGLTAPLMVIVANIASIGLLRRGRFQPAVLVSSLSVIGGATLVLWSWGPATATGTLTIYLISLTMTGLLGSRRVLTLTAALCVGIVVLATGVESLAPSAIGFFPLRGDRNILSGGTFVLVTGVVLALLLRFGLTMRVTLQRALSREQELERLHAGLEDRVLERTASLQEALQTVAQREEQLRSTLEDLQSSREVVRELSAPILPILPGVLVAPLIGAMDSARTRTLTQHVLDKVAEERAQVVIFDVTGVAIVDTHVAQALLQTNAAVELLGAGVVIVGIRPEVAQTIVGLNISLGGAQTFPTLQEAVVHLIRERVKA